VKTGQYFRPALCENSCQQQGGSSSSVLHQKLILTNRGGWTNVINVQTLITNLFYPISKHPVVFLFWSLLLVNTADTSGWDCKTAKNESAERIQKRMLHMDELDLWVLMALPDKGRHLLWNIHICLLRNIPTVKYSQSYNIGIVTVFPLWNTKTSLKCKD
jgi:hypothetical protein